MIFLNESLLYLLLIPTIIFAILIVTDKSQIQRYFDKDIAIVEGVMGYYDGMDKGASAYDVSQMLGIASVLILDASGSYITIVAVLKGLITFRENNTIKAIVLNKVSSKMHYDLIKKHIKDLKDNDYLSVKVTLNRCVFRTV